MGLCMRDCRVCVSATAQVVVQYLTYYQWAPTHLLAVTNSSRIYDFSPHRDSWVQGGGTALDMVSSAKLGRLLATAAVRPLLAPFS